MARTHISAPGLKLEVSNYQDTDGHIVVLRGYAADNYPTLNIHLTRDEADALAAHLLKAVAAVDADAALEA